MYQKDKAKNSWPAMLTKKYKVALKSKKVVKVLNNFYK